MDKQRRIIIFSVLFGVGVGMTVTSLINYMNPTVKYKEYSESEIKKIAYEIGMIDPKKIQIVENDLDGNKSIIKNESLGQDAKKQVEDQSNIQSRKTFKTFEIEMGESSETIIDNLYDARIIDNIDEFEGLVKGKGAEKRFKFGTYEIAENIDYNTLIDILCGDIKPIN